MTQEERLKEIIGLLAEKGYDPIAQLTGYIELESDDYITRHGGAREKIREVAKDVIESYLNNHKLR